MRLCILVTLSLFLVALFLLALFLLIPVPLAILPAVVKSQVYIQQKDDGQLPKATFFWSSLPATQFFDFYFFNVTNPDEVVYNGAMANLVEVGPYSYAETEIKEDITFYSGKDMVYYRNNKTWVWSQSTSCSTCNYNDVLTMSNPSYMSLVYMQKTQNMTGLMVTVLDLFSILLGEAPIRTVPMSGVTFLGYDDPLTDFLNSPLVKTALTLFPNPPPVPQVPAMGYFPLYNKTSDGNYTSMTGKDNTDNLGLIQTWCNRSHLPWWKDEYSQDIRGSGDGSFQKPILKKTDKLKHSFNLHFDEEVTVNGIDAYRFKMDTDTYDTTTEQNKGYRYENAEMVDYFPTWPCGSNHTYNPSGGGCDTAKCALRSQWCNPCCNGTHYKDTVFLPPGIIPLRCLPGQLVDLPFAGFLSPPHFLWSPPEVQQSMYGLHPDPVKHDPGAFDIQPLTGSTVGAYFRMQLSVPIYNDQQFTLMHNLRNSFIPTFWLNLRVVLRDYATDYIHFNTSTLPHIILGVGIGLLCFSVICALLLIFWQITVYRKGRVHIDNDVIEDANDATTDKENAWE